ncbi:MAG: OsmC family protein [Oceanospirillaceae bacterium]|nr:OsmC family protein [Oceanospirillaceae bacterium]
MSVHQSELSWSRAPHNIEADTYCRNHKVTLNGGQTVDVSASLDFKGEGHCADPEQMLVSALASCHMLFFLAIADHQGFCVESYDDIPKGYLEKHEKGMAVTRIELAPKVVFSGEKQPDAATLDRIHHMAHKNCFIRNSLIATVDINPR